jgi:hypothetical protein
MTEYNPLRPNTVTLVRADVERMKNTILTKLQPFGEQNIGLDFRVRSFLSFWYPTVDDITVTLNITYDESFADVSLEVVHILKCCEYQLGGRICIVPEFQILKKEGLMSISYTFETNKTEYEKFGTEE